eukprot:8250546-Pyramimonas_sp.AAC.1
MGYFGASALLPYHGKGGFRRHLGPLWAISASGSKHGYTLVSYSAGISACEKSEQWQRALALLSAMWEVKLEPNVISPTIAGAP